MISPTRSILRFLTTLMFAIALTACGDSDDDGGNGNGSGGGAGGDGSGGQPPVTQTLTIAGDPAESVEQGVWYQFKPSVAGVNGDVLSFSITNRPSWATFDVGTGELQGMPGPGDIGDFPGIVITAHNGTRTAALDPFTIEVLPATGNEGSGDGTSGDSGDSGDSGGSSGTDDSGGSGDSGDGSGDDSGGSSGAGDDGGDDESGSGDDGGSGASGGDDGSDGGTDHDPVNTPPTISGTPASEVMQDQHYSFTPTANDADGDALTFSISSRPAWAQFNSQTGQLSGTPGAADVGTYSNIVITVSDGQVSASLTAFSVSVVATATGSTMISWQAPTEREDGTQLSNDVAGFKIYWGTTQGHYPYSVTIDGVGVTEYLVEGLTPNTWYFVATAFDHDGLESGYSNVGTKTIK